MNVYLFLFESCRLLNHIICTHLTRSSCHFFTDWRIIELQQVFFQNTKPSRVLVEALPFVRNADQVFMEPLSVEDWELLETYAEDLEAGDLLQQISIVYPDQVVPLQVEPGVLANVRVLATSFGTHPHDANDVNMDPPCCCMRLVADTEVVISPKPAVTLTEPVLRVLASFEEYSEVMQDLASSLDHGSTQDRLQPCSVAVHPNTLSKTPGWIYGAEGSVVALLSRTDTVEMDDPSSASAVASVIPSTLVSEDAIGKFLFLIYSRQALAVLSLRNNTMLILKLCF